jgi:ribosomal protein S18 acetylase RimI-like enzyme
MIRAASEADLGRLLELNRQVHDLHRAALPARYRDPSREEVEALFRERLGAPDVAVLVVEVGGEGPAGYVVLRRIDSPAHPFAHARVTAHVDEIGVDRFTRRSGHGRALMAAARRQAVDWAAVAITLDVQAFNREAVAFYQAIGWEIATHRMSRPTAAPDDGTLDP